MNPFWSGFNANEGRGHPQRGLSQDWRIATTPWGVGSRFWVTAPCCLAWLLLSPGLSRAEGSARGPIATAAFTTEEQSAERNWYAFWNNHLGTWKGSWTRYTPEGDVKESFASTREFTANSATTEIVQNNRYQLCGRSLKTHSKTWSYNVKDHNQLDGFAHPASIPMRGLALDNGAAAWLIPSLKPNQFTPFELFLMDGDRRHSVGVLYGKDGALLRTASIREQRGNAPTDGWTDAIKQVEPWHPVGQWQGQGRLILKGFIALARQPNVLAMDAPRRIGSIQSLPSGSHHPALSKTHHSDAALFHSGDLDVARRCDADHHSGIRQGFRANRRDTPKPQSRDASELRSNWITLKVPNLQRSETLTKLGEIKLKQIPQLNTANSSPLIRKHKEVLNLMMRTLSLDTYGLTWAQFIKGFGCGALAVWLLMR